MARIGDNKNTRHNEIEEYLELPVVWRHKEIAEISEIDKEVFSDICRLQEEQRCIKSESNMEGTTRANLMPKDVISWGR